MTSEPHPSIHQPRDPDRRFAAKVPSWEPPVHGYEDYGYAGYYSGPVHARVPDACLAERPWPRMTAMDESVADSAVATMTALARQSGVRVRVGVPLDGHAAACYDPPIRTITVHPQVASEPLCMAFALAHELGHAFDPVGSRTSHHHHRDSRAAAEAEIVAEAGAIKMMKVLGIELEGEHAYIDRFDWVQRRGGWRKAISPGRKLADRYTAVVLNLMAFGSNPAVDDISRRELDRIYKRADAEVRRREEAYQRWA